MIVGLVGAFLTAAYMTRCVYLTFLGTYRGGDHGADVARVRLRAGAGHGPRPRRRADGRGGRRHLRHRRDDPDAHVGRCWPTRSTHDAHGHDATAPAGRPRRRPRRPRRARRAARVAARSSRCRSSSWRFLAITVGFLNNAMGHPHATRSSPSGWRPARSADFPELVRHAAVQRRLLAILASPSAWSRSSSCAWLCTSDRDAGRPHPAQQGGARGLRLPRGTSTTSTPSTRTSSWPASRGRSPGSRTGSTRTCSTAS